jgi:hypothetical protein
MIKSLALAEAGTVIVAEAGPVATPVIEVVTVVVPVGVAVASPVASKVPLDRSWRWLAPRLLRCRLTPGNDRPNECAREVKSVNEGVGAHRVFGDDGTQPLGR